jgi:hypothetical protein
MKFPRYIRVFLAVLLGTTLFVGYVTRTDPEVAPAYLNGILTASGILFGIWTIIIGKDPESELKKVLSPTVGQLFTFGLVLLVSSVVFVVLTALGTFSSAVALVFCAMSFVTNAYSVYRILSDKFKLE